ncbi:MAG TPA: Gfo/Idh/MocA family oxidoreductase [Chthonomonadales bacterium]|nr:Gfo/Idh/MocA family oxidoreductase [Chthonomonadales bacterium]
MPVDSSQVHLAYHGEALSRREVVQGGAAIAAAMGVSLTSLAEGQTRRAANAGSPRPVSCALVGIGSQGTLILRRALSVPGVKITALCDTYRPNLERAMRLAPGAAGVADYRSVLDRRDVEAVLIATSLVEHGPIAVAALEAGKHVFCEKMMAYSIEDSKAMARAHLAARKVLQIGHQRRSNVTYNHGWELVNKARILGKLTHVRAQWNRNGKWRRDPVPSDTTDRHWNWRMYKDISQGLMGELGTHQVHVANWYLGEAPSAVVGIGGIDFWKDGRTVFDNIMLVMEYPSGARMSYTSLTTNQYDGFYEQFMGKDGTLIVSQQTGGQYFREPTAQADDWMRGPVNRQAGARGQAGVKLDPEATKKLGTTGARVGQRTITAEALGKDDYLLQMEDFFASVRTGAPTLCDWRDGLAATVAAVRANEAMERQTRVEIPASDYAL